MMPMIDLDPIKARLAAATPGPWTPVETHKQSATDSFFSVAVVGRREVRATIPSQARPDERDAALIASAPADLAALVAEVERLREALANLLDAWNDYQPSLDFDGRMNDAVNDAALAAQAVLE